MAVERFIDTNILLYAYDLECGSKREVAAKLLKGGWLRAGTNAISVQVLQEFYVNLLRCGQSHEVACEIIADLCQWPVVENTLELLGQGLVLRQRFQISLWDAMVLAAAKVSGAKELITEDLNPGQDYDGILVCNPFQVV